MGADPVQARRTVPLFSSLERRDLERLARQMRDRIFREGSAVTAGESGAGFFVFVEGS